MKRIKFLILAVLCVLICGNFSFYAKESDGLMEDLSEEVGYSSLLELIPEESLEVLDQLGFDLSEEVAAPDLGTVLKFCFQSLCSVCLDYLPLFSAGLLLLILMKILSHLRVGSDSLAEGMGFLSVICSGVFSFSVLDGVLSSLVSVAERSAAFLTAALPVTLSSLALSGSPTGASVVSSTIPTVFSIFSALVASLFYPLCLFCFSASLCGVFRDGFSLRPLVSSVRKFCNRGVEVLSGLSVGVFCVQRAVVSSSDSFARRSVRFALAKLIPVAGSPLTEGIETVCACGKSLSGKVGVICVLVLVGMFATPCILGFFFCVLYSVLGSVGAVMQVPLLTDFFDDVKDTFATMTCFAICSLTVLSASLLILTG